jgi:hypothetical protein
MEKLEKPEKSDRQEEIPLGEGALEGLEFRKNEQSEKNALMKRKIKKILVGLGGVGLTIGQLFAALEFINYFFSIAI